LSPAHALWAERAIAGGAAPQRRGQWRARPGDAVVPDLIKEPGVKAARQEPFDAIAAPENPPPFEIAVFQIDHVIAGAPIAFRFRLLLLLV